MDESEISNYSRKMFQTATYWAPLPPGITGQTTFSAPVIISCRWEDKQVLFKNKEGKDVLSDAIVYVDRPLVLEGYLSLGVSMSTDPRGIGREIQAVGKTVNVRARKRLNKVML
jgi:hypothetical protein